MKFHKYWEQENYLLKLSYKESVRQLEERKMKKKEECDTHSKEKVKLGECCKQEIKNIERRKWESVR